MAELGLGFIQSCSKGLDVFYDVLTVKNKIRAPAWRHRQHHGTLVNC